MAKSGPSTGGAIKQGFGWAIGCLLFIIVAVIGLAVLGGLGRTTSSATQAPLSVTPAVPAATDTRPPAAAVLLDLKGKGIKRSAKFTTSGDWTIDWSYDCSS